MTAVYSLSEHNVSAIDANVGSIRAARRSRG
jgi:hypothetical protein